MLTKARLSFRTRQGRVYPQLVQGSKLKAAIELIEELLVTLSEMLSQRRELVEHSLYAGHAPASLRCGLVELILDACEWTQSEESWSERRHHVLTVAAELQQEQMFDSMEGFREQLLLRLGEDASLLTGLYDDLPHRALLLKVPAQKEPLAWIHQYNRNQVQGLLMQAEEVELHLDKKAGLASARKLMQAIKFHSLVAEISSTRDQGFKLLLSGPGSVVEASAKYGKNFARFFASLCHFKHWSLEATIRVQKKKLCLLIDSDFEWGTLLATGHYIPPEWNELLKEATIKSEGTWEVDLEWSVSEQGEGELYFPDFYLRQNKTALPVEIFHRWHQGALEQRLLKASAPPFGKAVFAVDRSLSKKSSLAGLLEKSKDRGINIIYFRDLLSSRDLLKAVNFFEHRAKS